MSTPFAANASSVRKSHLRTASTSGTCPHGLHEHSVHHRSRGELRRGGEVGCDKYVERSGYLGRKISVSASERESSFFCLLRSKQRMPSGRAPHCFRRWLLACVPRRKHPTLCANFFLARYLLQTDSSESRSCAVRKSAGVAFTTIFIEPPNRQTRKHIRWRNPSHGASGKSCRSDCISNLVAEGHIEVTRQIQSPSCDKLLNHARKCPAQGCTSMAPSVIDSCSFRR